MLIILCMVSCICLFRKFKMGRRGSQDEDMKTILVEAKKKANFQFIDFRKA